MKSFSPQEITTFIVTTSAIYLAVLPIGIPHLTFCLSVIIITYACIYRSIDKAAFGWLCVFSLMAVLYLKTGSDWKTTFNNISSMMMFPIVIVLLKNYKTNNLLKITITFIKLTLLIFTIECFIRYTWSTIAPSGVGFYRFKFHSILFQDTNFLGLALIVIIFLIKYLKIFYGIKKLNRLYELGIILLFLSISRAAILGWLISELLFYGISSNNFVRKSLIRTIVLIFLSIFLGSILYNYLSEDPSFKSKLYILDLASEVKDQYSHSKLFGLGFGNSEEALGIFPHNFFFLYYLEIGIVGLSVKILYLLYILFKTKFQGFIVLLPYALAVMSATGYGTHYFYVSLALIALLSKRNSNENFHTHPYLQR